MAATHMHLDEPNWGLRWLFILYAAAIWLGGANGSGTFWIGLLAFPTWGLLGYLMKGKTNWFNAQVLILGDTLGIGFAFALLESLGPLTVAFLGIALAMAATHHWLPRVGLTTIAVTAWVWASAPMPWSFLLPGSAFLIAAAFHFASLSARQQEAEAVNQQVDQERKELWTLLEISETISATLDLKQVMRVIVERVGESMGTPSVSILLTDEKLRQGFVVAANENPDIDMLPVELENYPEIKRALTTQEPVVIQDVRKDPTVAEVRKVLLAKGYQSALVVPLVFGREVLGTLFIRGEQTSPFTEQQIRFCKVVAGAGANALKNALLYQEVAKESEDHRHTGETLRCILNATPDLIIATDVTGKVVEINHGGEDLMGTSREEVLGRNAREVLSLDEAINVDSPVHVEAGIEQRETKLERPRGGTLELHLLQAPLRDADGKKSGEVWIGRDVSRLRRVERSLAQAERLSSLGEIVAGVAHELNNPLSGVVGYAELLKSSMNETEVLRDLEKIVEASQRCQKIVLNLLSFSRKHKAEKARHQLNHCVEKVLELKEYHLRANNIIPVLDFDSQLPSTCFDFHQIEQVILNLIQNGEQAIRATGQGGSIRFKTYQDGNFICLEVHDDGDGVPEEAREKLFDPFFTTKEVGEGTGLGLSVSFGIVREHEGTLELVNSPDAGACFRMSLPIVKSETATMDSPLRLEDGDCTPLNGARILIADDEEMIRELMFRVLREHGALVRVAGDGEEAWQWLQREEFDLVVTDLRMPNLDGRTLYERTVESRPELMRRFVFSTGDIIHPDTVDFLEQVPNRILTKPLQPETVRRILSRALEG